MMRAAAIVCAFALLPSPPEPAIRFEDISTTAGLSASIRNGDPARRWIVEANGTGVAVLDFDNDGWTDLAIGSGGNGIGDILRKAPGGRRLILYRNLGNGRFEDVTARSGLENPYWTTGLNAADFDGDGDTDLLVTNIGADLLFRNNGDGTFTETGARAGLSRQAAWHTGSSFGDYDGDGDLDLYIAGYVSLKALSWKDAPPVCDYRGMPAFCGPLNLAGEPDVLYRNNGDGTFTDVTTEAGVADTALRYGFGALFEDLDGDGRTDLFVTNDSGANYFYRNRGGGRFEESALAAGLAYNADGKSQANMGIAAGDIDNDGDTDLLVTTFSEDYFPLFEQIAPGRFEDISAKAGLVQATTPLLGWACGFADFDNDGDLDLWTANGHVYPTAGTLATTAYRQPIAVFENRGARFRAVPHTLPSNSYRGGAAADFDNDGLIDLVAVPIEGPPLLARNQSPARQAQWIGFALNTEGAALRLRACGTTQTAKVRNGAGYISRQDPRLHFGLGACRTIDSATVIWPGGKEQPLAAKPGRYHSVTRPR